jgi:hypothetical protein
MTELLGFIGFIVTLLVIVPASILALIQVFSHPVREITNLWTTLADKLMDIYEQVRNDFRNYKDKE